MGLQVRAGRLLGGDVVDEGAREAEAAVGARPAAHARAALLHRAKVFGVGRVAEVERAL